MIKRKLLVCILLLLFITACGSSGSDPFCTIGEYNISQDSKASAAGLSDSTPADDVLSTVNPCPLIDDAAFQNFVYSSNHFGIELFQKYSSSNSGNSLLGVYSIEQLLGMASLGAKNNTAAEIEKLWFSEGDVFEGWQNLFCGVSGSISMSGSVAVGHENYLFLEKYLTELASYFSPDFYESFADGEIVPELWRHTLLRKEQRIFPLGDVFVESTILFENLDSKQFWVPANTFQGAILLFEDEKAKMYEIAIAESDLKIQVLMPQSEYFEEIGSDLALFYEMYQARMILADSKVYIPLFSRSENNGLADQLKDLGVQDPFLVDSADFSGINNQGYLFLEDINHSAVFEIDEKSLTVEAVSLTQFIAHPNEPENVWRGGFYGSFFKTTSIGDRYFQICEDVYIPEREPDMRPFFYFLTDSQTGMIHYIGNVALLEGEEAGHWVCQ